MKKELLEGIEKLDRWIVNLPPRERLDINPFDYINSNNIRPDMAIKILEEATSKGMFIKIYRYRDEYSGEVIASSSDPTKLKSLLLVRSKEENLIFIPELVEKAYKLKEDISESYNPLQVSGYGGGENRNNINYYTLGKARVLGIEDEYF